MRVEHSNWFQRMGGAMCGVCVGFLLLLGSSAVLWFNEGAAVQTAYSLEEGLDRVLAIDATAVDARDAGKLVHFAGVVQHDPVVDSAFGIVDASAVVLRRNVEMLQWREVAQTRTVKDNVGGETKYTEYSYETVWTSNRIDSSRFDNPNYRNPSPSAAKSSTIVAKDVYVGQLRVDDAVRQLAVDKRVDVSDPAVSAIAAANVGGQLADGSTSTALSLYNGLGPLARQAVAVDNALYIGDPLQPTVGDLRVQYDAAAPEVLSVVGQQRGDGSIGAFPTDAGDDILLVSAGHRTALQMFEDARAAANVRTWVLRGVGALLMFVGALLVLQPAVIAPQAVPFIGSLLSGFVGAGACLLATAFAAAASLSLIGVAWFWYRPLVTVAAAVVAFGIMYMSKWPPARHAHVN